MKLHLQLLILTLLLPFSYGKNLSLPSVFNLKQPGTTPSGWKINPWSGYSPHAKLSLDNNSGQQALHIFQATAPYGFALNCSQSFSAHAGETVVIRSRIKGRGILWFQLHTYTRSGTNTGILPARGVVLTSHWQDVTVALPVNDIDNKKTERILIALGVTRNTDTWISSFQTELLPSQPEAGINIDGNFLTISPQGGSIGWKRNNWSGYKPYASAVLVSGSNPGENALDIHNVQGKHGALYYSTKLTSCRRNDKVRLTFKVRGNGKCFVGLNYYNQEKKWLDTSFFKEVNLKKTWQDHTVEITVGEGLQKEANYIAPFLGCRQNGTVQFTSVQMSYYASPYQGTLNFPLHWKAFIDTDIDYQPAFQELNTIPAKLAGTTPTLVQLQSGMLDFKEITGRKLKKRCCWLFAELNAPEATAYTLGAGADWWMTVYVNGNPAIDTRDTGNIKTPYSINNHTATVHLKKGRNILAIRYVSGSIGNTIHLGGPNELRQLKTVLELKKILLMDDYDKPAVKRPGKPEIIFDYPTPGLNARTGQGVYQTVKPLRIFLKKEIWRLPQSSGSWFATGTRIQNFGRTRRISSSLSLRFRTEKQSCQLVLDHQADSDEVSAAVLSEGRKLLLTSIPYEKFPADISFFAHLDGMIQIKIHSLVDSSSNIIKGNVPFFARLGGAAFKTDLLFQSKDRHTAEVVLDNYMIGSAVITNSFSKVPFSINIMKKFDPVKLGWKLVFEDDFNGTEFDWTKWFNYTPMKSKKHMVSLDGKGNLHIRCDKDPKDPKGRRRSAMLWTRDKFKYGYFEARLKFTRQPQWWSAFWMYGDYNSNPMLDGFEIDIFEDYHTRITIDNEKHKDFILDHNVHTYCGVRKPALSYKSWNYLTKLPRSIDDFYVIGCKWTPFEISYYLDGKLMASSSYHSPYDSVTFDAFHHGTSICPLHISLCGQIGSPVPTPWKGPEDFVVDYVRAYALPEDNPPSIEWDPKNTDMGLWSAPGKVQTFTASASPSPVTQSKIKAVYLFDNGFVMDYKTKPPYTFKIPFSEEHYNGTAFMKPGRSGRKPTFDCPHAYVLFVQDAKGAIAHSSPLVKYKKPSVPSTPYQGKVLSIPGKLLAGTYDEGGADIAYRDSSKGNCASKTFRPNEDVDCVENALHSYTAEWLNYTVDIKEAGNYSAEALYVVPFKGEQNIYMYLDNQPVGIFKLHAEKHTLYPEKDKAPHFWFNPENGAFRFGRQWGCDSTARISGLKLPKGRHVITLFLVGGFNLSSIEFKKD